MVRVQRRHGRRVPVTATTARRRQRAARTTVIAVLRGRVVARTADVAVRCRLFVVIQRSQPTACIVSGTRHAQALADHRQRDAVRQTLLGLFVIPPSYHASERERDRLGQAFFRFDFVAPCDCRTVERHFERRGLNDCGRVATAMRRSERHVHVLEIEVDPFGRGRLTRAR